MTKPYTRRSAEQWQAILHDQRVSGQSQQRYCEDKGIAFSTFQAWRKRLSSTTAVPEFVEIPRSTPAAPLDSGLTVRVELGAGVVLELSRA